MDIIDRIAHELSVRPQQVRVAVSLLDGGATVPFLARYRKEATGGLDDTQLRTLDQRLTYLRELDHRRQTVLDSIRAQGKLTPELESTLREVDSKTRLEDLYLPFKPRRRTRAQIAREAGLEPLADSLLSAPEQDPVLAARAYLNDEQGFADVATTLSGAQQILIERFADDADLAGELREWVWSEAILESRVIDGMQESGQKFRDYFRFSEKLSGIPSHRALALFRGRKENVLEHDLLPSSEPEAGHQRCQQRIARHFGIEDRGRPADTWLQQTVRLAWKARLFTRIELDLKLRLREAAELDAINVFANNLKDLLLTAPAGLKATLGLDPGLRTGVKVAVVDPTGKVVETDTIYPHVPNRQWRQSLQTLDRLVSRHNVELIAIGNGTASRETEKLARELIQSRPGRKPAYVTVSEAGASVYSASELAAREFPQLDVSLRGAVSIARRLQDPLAELVKIEPRAIGVGQYQHDVNQARLGRSLDAVVEDCVNAVGVDVNTASSALLSRVSGLSPALAENIVSYRDEHGIYTNRKQLTRVPRLGAKTFEQAAGFLRVRNGDNPLDASAVHPEAYPVVERISLDCAIGVGDLIGDKRRLAKLDPSRYTDRQFGLPTVTDILRELEKPGRDPRPEFRTVRYQEDVENLADLRPGMWLEGVVSNVTNFGAFVDIGVHQDGLVHISQLADRFVRDPREVVKAGDIVRARVVAVDVGRRRIGLSLRPADPDEPPSEQPPRGRPDAAGGPGKRRPRTDRNHSESRRGALADALKKALKH